MKALKYGRGLRSDGPTSSESNGVCDALAQRLLEQKAAQLTMHYTSSKARMVETRASRFMRRIVTPSRVNNKNAIRHSPLSSSEIAALPEMRSIVLRLGYHNVFAQAFATLLEKKLALPNVTHADIMGVIEKFIRSHPPSQRKVLPP